MSNTQNQHLLEVIFELKWGQKSPSEFIYTPEEQSLFPLKFNSGAVQKGFNVIEQVQQNAPANIMLPLIATHRFRKEVGTWPCYQIGLGIFTANQIKDGYEWESFRKIIEDGLEIFDGTDDSSKIVKVQQTLTLSLYYQNEFYPDDTVSTQEFIEKTFKFIIGLPKDFIVANNLNDKENKVNMSFSIASKLGELSVSIMSAIIKDKPGLIVNVGLNTNYSQLTSNGLVSTLDKDAISKWADDAHILLYKTFDKLIGR